ncbi:ketoacyl-synthetase C-terminal extension domain-containing protein [Streptomyces sp. GD-15H]|uniref:type I polyketide synthase n=1 Tax=Streptomyces sp. GD-15H TaxID=3129112 RepID=UPI003250C2FC
MASHEGTEGTGVVDGTNATDADIAIVGMAGPIKTVLTLRHRALVPSLNFESSDPEVDFAVGPFHVNTETRPWPAGATPRRAGVSSFGVGGTNAHAALEEPPASAPRPGTRAAGPRLLVLPARSAVPLDTATARLARHLRQHRDLDLTYVAQTLALGRRIPGHRRALVVTDVRDAALALPSATRPGSSPRPRPARGRCCCSTAPPPCRGSTPRTCRNAYRPSGSTSRAAPNASAPPTPPLCRQPAVLAAFAVQYTTPRTLTGWGCAPRCPSPAPTTFPDRFAPSRRTTTSRRSGPWRRPTSPCHWCPTAAPQPRGTPERPETRLATCPARGRPQGRGLTHAHDRRDVWAGGRAGRREGATVTGPTECHVWLAPVLADPALLDFLDPGERERVRGLLLEEARTLSTTAHALLRLVVAARTGVEPRQVRLVRTCRGCGGAHGKPRLADPPADLEFSLSHCADLVAVAVTVGRPVGVDIETVGHLDGDRARLPRVVLSETEQRVLAAQPTARAPGAFTRYWARKEAVLKATGDGLTVNPADLTVSGPDTPATLLGWRGRPHDRAPLPLADVAAGPDHRCAVAFVGPHAPGFRVVRHWLPDVRDAVAPSLRSPTPAPATPLAPGCAAPASPAGG